jgi:dCTP deaminase
MLLNDKTIREQINSGKIHIRPSIHEVQIQPASLDVRVDNEVYYPEQDKLETEDVITIEPGEFVLTQTLEHIGLPDDLGSFMTGRSSIGRSGLIVHTTAGWIDPGFHGTITMEMYNVSQTSVTVKAGERVAQLLFFKMAEPAVDEYDGQYQSQIHPQK